MTQVTELTATDIALAEMLVENTGRHILDSGGAYGRNWERAQAVTGVKPGEDGAAEAAARFFYDRPEATIDLFGDGFADVTLDLFHYLRKRVTYLPEESEAFAAFASRPERERDSWQEVMRKWLESQEGFSDGFHSANYENFLSQEIQGSVYEMPYPGSNAVLLQIHGGADIRGGYTAPKVFAVDGSVTAEDAITCLLGDCDSYELVGEAERGDDRWASYRGEWDLDLTPEEWLAESERWPYAYVDFKKFTNRDQADQIQHRDTGEVVEILMPEPAW